MDWNDTVMDEVFTTKTPFELVVLVRLDTAFDTLSVSAEGSIEEEGMNVVNEDSLTSCVPDINFTINELPDVYRWSNAVWIVWQGRSLHPHVLLSTPDDDDDTYTSVFCAELGVYTRCSISIILEEYFPIYFPSSEDEYGVPTKALHPLYPVKLVSDEAVIYTFDPVDAVHEEKEREEKERVFVEM